jgi:hypothetical protein
VKEGAGMQDVFFPRETCHIFALFFCVASIFMSIVGQFFGTWFFLMVFYFQLRN